MQNPSLIKAEKEPSAGQNLALPLSRSKQAGIPGFTSSCLMRAFSGPKSRPATVAEQTGRHTWIYFVMFDERYVQTCVRSENPGRNTGVT